MGMMEYFADDWMPVNTTLTRVVSTKNAAGQVVQTATNITGTHNMAKWVTASVQTNQSDKFVLYETGKLAMDYKKFYIGSVEVFPDATWYATIDSKKYFIDGVDNIGSLNEAYLFTYHKDRQ